MRASVKPVILIVLSSLIFIFSCDKGPEADPEQNTLPVEGQPTFSGISGSSASFDVATATYTIIMPTGTDIKALKLKIPLAEGATISPDPSTARDYTNPLKYTITHNGKKYQIMVKVEVSTSTKLSDKRIFSFEFRTPTLDITGEVNQSELKITVRVPDTWDITTLTPNISYALRGSISPASGVPQNFANPVNYTVTAEDGGTQTYEVRVERVKSTIDKNVLYYMGYEETIEGEVYSVKYHTGYLIAINADTGEEIWRSQLGKIEPDVYAI